MIRLIKPLKTGEINHEATILPLNKNLFFFHHHTKLVKNNLPNPAQLMPFVPFATKL